MLLVKDGQEEKVRVNKREKNGLGFPLLNEQYNEEVSARSFQEALMQWRDERRGGGGPGKLYLSTCCITSFSTKTNGVPEENKLQQFY